MPHLSNVIVNATMESAGGIGDDNVRQSAALGYEANPTYEPVGQAVLAGWTAIAGSLPDGDAVLAIDGPEILAWNVLLDELAERAAADGRAITAVDARDALAPWETVLSATSSPGLRGDPDFEILASGTLAELFATAPGPALPRPGLTIVYGPGAAFAPHDVLWYVDLPKRFAEAAVTSGKGRNLGQRDIDGPSTTKRLFYVDWPLLDRHRDAIADRVGLWLDLQNPGRPVALDGAALRATLASLARRPFRTRPTFNTTTWGGHWAQRELGVNSDRPNTALGYELIAPESGVLIGRDHGTAVEIPFQLLVALHPVAVLGAAVHDVFGTSFPVRFDYLDTVGGGNLSVHCHPQSDYMRDVFGWAYPQHETYYLMAAGADSKVFLGVRGDADLEEFHRQASDAHHHGTAFDIERHVQTFPATAHQIYLIPAGTPHGSGVGNVVLEVSATPYLYSLRFYDWLRRGPNGGLRPVHVDHAFRNVDTRRTGERVRSELVPVPRTIRSGATWREELIGDLPEMFFEVRRLELAGEEPADDDTAGRFHVLNVVEGAGVSVSTGDGTTHHLAYAETMVIPAAVGSYYVQAAAPGKVRVVKALVR